MNQQATYSGIPNSLTLDFVRDWVSKRISEKRFKHTEGVAKVARQLALRAGQDPYLAELAGWLHDACKELKTAELIVLAEQGGISIHPIEKSHGYLLHGPVAALVAKKELQLTNQEVLNAISEHTLGAVPMSPLSEIMFLADCIDETRPKDYTKPIWEALDIDGKFNIPSAIVVACNLGLGFLLQDKKPIHPKTIALRNHYLELMHQGNS